MANTKNLKPIKKGELSSEEAKKRGSNGGIKSGEKRRERKALKELLEIALALPNEETGELNEIAITSAIIKQAIKGNVLAYTTIRDTVGEKPTDKIKNDVNCTVETGFESVEAFAKHFKEMIGG